MLGRIGKHTGSSFSDSMLYEGYKIQISCPEHYLNQDSYQIMTTTTTNPKRTKQVAVDRWQY